jgi:hypothetical protein
MMLSGQEYVDEYALKVKKEIAADLGSMVGERD